MDAFYKLWKMFFHYAQQPTVIDVACSIEKVDEIPPPYTSGEPLSGCN